jgi:hypothetical protein
VHGRHPGIVADRRLRNRRARLARLLDLGRWKPTRAGNLRIRYRRHRLVLYLARFAKGWRINVDAALGRRDHPTTAAAIRAAFGYLDPPIVNPWEAIP